MSAEAYDDLLQRARSELTAEEQRRLVEQLTQIAGTNVASGVASETGKSLYDALKPFNEFNINMSKIESRPSKKRDWEYFFFVDVLGHCTDEKLVTAIEELETHCSFIKILGSYPRAI